MHTRHLADAWIGHLPDYASAKIIPPETVAEIETIQVEATIVVQIGCCQWGA